VGWCVLIRTTYTLLGLISFLPLAKTNAAPGPFPLAPAPRRERALSTPIWKKHFIRAETIRWISARGAPKPMHAQRARYV